MTGFEARQPWLNIALVTAGLGCFLAAPTLGWVWAVVTGILAIPVVFGCLLGLSWVVSRFAGQDDEG